MYSNRDLLIEVIESIAKFLKVTEDASELHGLEQVKVYEARKCLESIIGRLDEE